MYYELRKSEISFDIKPTLTSLAVWLKLERSKSLYIQLNLGAELLQFGNSYLLFTSVFWLPSHVLYCYRITRKYLYTSHADVNHARHCFPFCFYLQCPFDSSINHESCLEWSAAVFKIYSHDTVQRQIIYRRIRQKTNSSLANDYKAKNYIFGIFFQLINIIKSVGTYFNREERCRYLRYINWRCTTGNWIFNRNFPLLRA